MHCPWHCVVFILPFSLALPHGCSLAQHITLLLLLLLLLCPQKDVSFHTAEWHAARIASLTVSV